MSVCSTQGELLALNLREAARMLSISPRTLWSLAKQGQIPSVRLGTGRGRLLFPRKALEEWLAQQTAKASK